MSRRPARRGFGQRKAKQTNERCAVGKPTDHTGKQELDRCWSGTGLESPVSDFARGRETERQRDRETERQRDRETERQSMAMFIADRPPSST